MDTLIKQKVNKTKGYIYSINTKFPLLKYHYIVKYKNIELSS